MWSVSERQASTLQRLNTALMNICISISSEVVHPVSNDAYTNDTHDFMTIESSITHVCRDSKCSFATLHEYALNQARTRQMCFSLHVIVIIIIIIISCSNSIK